MFYLEKAEAIKKLMEMKKWNPVSAADNLGIARSYLLYLLSLVDAPKEVMEIRGRAAAAQAGVNFLQQEI